MSSHFILFKDKIISHHGSLSDAVDKAKEFLHEIDGSAEAEIFCHIRTVRSQLAFSVDTVDTPGSSGGGGSRGGW